MAKTSGVVDKFRSPAHGGLLLGTSATSRPGKGGKAFQKGLEALRQYVAREGRLPGRAVVDVLPDGAEHRTGIWIGNQKARRDRLDAGQLAELGVEWATA
ncbi:helicase associated domain-containing protein [Streptomyces sp. NPDC003042]